jgi:hypothetical protein
MVIYSVSKDKNYYLKLQKKSLPLVEYDNPTGNRNSYLVLHLNFAMVSGSIDYRQSFDGYCDLIFKHFCKTHKEFYPEDAQEPTFTMI